MLGRWVDESMSCLSHWPSELAYYNEDCRISSPDVPADITTFVPQDLKVKFSQHFHAAVHHQFTMNRTAAILCVVLLIFFTKGQLISDNFFYNIPKNQRVEGWSKKKALDDTLVTILTHWSALIFWTRPLFL